MITQAKKTFQTTEESQVCVDGDIRTKEVIKFKKRMLEWPNPVEYVNNMYGSHPDDDDSEYFKVIFAK